jgi:hypothetical protein
VQTLDAADTETIELLAREVIPRVLPVAGKDAASREA